MHHPALRWLSWILDIFLIVYIARKYIQSLEHRPSIQKTDIVYQDWFASGHSQKNIITRFGGARNCLRLVVTDEILWVTSWPFFTIITAAYDLEHVIQLRSIKKVEKTRMLGKRIIKLTYADELYDLHTLVLMPRREDDFLKSLKFDMADSHPSS